MFRSRAAFPWERLQKRMYFLLGCLWHCKLRCERGCQEQSKIRGCLRKLIPSTGVAKNIKNKKALLTNVQIWKCMGIYESSREIFENICQKWAKGNQFPSQKGSPKRCQLIPKGSQGGTKRALESDPKVWRDLPSQDLLLRSSEKRFRKRLSASSWNGTLLGAIFHSTLSKILSD